MIFAWLRRRRLARERLYVVETPYTTMWNVDPEGLVTVRKLREQYPPTWPETIREMTLEEKLEHAS